MLVPKPQRKNKNMKTARRCVVDIHLWKLQK